MIPSPLHTLVTLTLIFPCTLCSPKSSPDKPPSNQYLRKSVATAATTATVADGEKYEPISLSPPIARREENRVVYAGITPPKWDPTLPRQSANSTNPLINPPIPIPDPYGWIRDDTRFNPEILHHLTAENEYTLNYTRHLKGLRHTLYEELVSSLVETDYSMPRPYGEWMYYTRTFEGMSYGSYCRAPRTADMEEDYVETVNDWDGSKDSPILPGEEVYLDVNELAMNRAYCGVGTVSMSPSRELVAYTVDYSGNEVYELHVRNFTSGEDVVLKKTAAAGVEGDDDDNDDDLLELDDFVWGKDDTTLYYTTMDDAHRSYRLYKRENWNSEVNNDSDTVVDTLLKEEDDALFSSGIGKSLDERYIFYEAESEETSEVWYIDLLPTTTAAATDGDEGDGSPHEEEEEMKCVSLRRNNVQYDVESHGDNWYIITNVNNSINQKLMMSPAKSHSDDDWELVLDGDGNPIFDGSSLDDKKSLDSITAFETHAVLEGREDGIPRVWIYSFETKDLTRLEFEDAAYDVGLSTNHEVDTDKIVISYSSMLTPPSSIEVSLEDDSQRRVLKTNAVPGYDKDLYGTNRLHVLSRDGNTQIPISVVYRKDTMEKVEEAGQPVPVHLYGYGSYGSSIEADFSSSRLPLLNRGIIYVIAHVRGGGELGRAWYEEPHGAKLLCKENTFNDFVDVARFLVGNDWTTPELLSCEGRSAGGLLIGASINQDPELFRVAILGVPFVDVAVTMTDASIPLTTGEWIEWGNPNEEKYFQYMMDYSPMNNVQTGKKYPSCLITGGLHDPRVAYWEPTKFAATLRHANPDNENPVCMKVDMSSGHFSASDRYEHYRGLAYDYSFVLDQLGLGERPHGEFHIAVTE